MTPPQWLEPSAVLITASMLPSVLRLFRVATRTSPWNWSRRFRLPESGLRVILRLGMFVSLLGYPRRQRTAAICEIDMRCLLQANGHGYRCLPLTRSLPGIPVRGHNQRRLSGLLIKSQIIEVDQIGADPSCQTDISRKLCASGDRLFKSHIGVGKPVPP